MQAKIIGGKGGPGFQPCILRIELKTEDDAREIWHRLNVPNSRIMEFSDPDCVPPPERTDCYSAFNVLDDHLEELGLTNHL